MKTPDVFSWSQYSLWKQSKYQWYKKYVLNENIKSNKYFDKGDLLAKCLDTGIIPEWNDDEMLPVLLKTLPKLELTEELVEVEIKNGKKIKCYIDTSNKDGKLFYDYKTGKNEWDDIDVLNHEQLLFYSLSYYIRSGRKLVPNSGIIWVETIEEEVDGYNKIYFTGVHKLIERIINEDEIIAFENKLIETLLEIESYEYIETEIDENLFLELQNIKIKIKELQNREQELNTLLISLIKSDDTSKGVCGAGYITIVERKKWVFSDDVYIKEEAYKKEIEVLKSSEKNTGIAKQVKDTEYLKLTTYTSF